MIIKATFTGKDSLGYVHGKEYELTIDKVQQLVIIQRLDKTGGCPYSSFITFLQNWNKITVIN